MLVYTLFFFSFFFTSYLVRATLVWYISVFGYLILNKFLSGSDQVNLFYHNHYHNYYYWWFYYNYCYCILVEWICNKWISKLESENEKICCQVLPFAFCEWNYYYQGPSFYRNRSSQACPLFHYLVIFFFIFEWHGHYPSQNQIGFFVYFFLFAESVMAVDKRFIACVLASAFLCCLPPPPPDALVRSLNFNNFFACFHRYDFKEAFLGLV